MPCICETSLLSRMVTSNPVMQTPNVCWLKTFWRFVPSRWRSCPRHTVDPVNLSIKIDIGANACTSTGLKRKPSEFALDRCSSANAETCPAVIYAFMHFGVSLLRPRTRPSSMRKCLRVSIPTSMASILKRYLTYTKHARFNSSSREKSCPSS